MLKQVTFKNDFRCIKAGEVFTFLPGVNLIVGDQGSGKSSLLAGIRKTAITDAVVDDKAGFVFCDFEKQNPRMAGLPNTRNGDFYKACVLTHFASHGEVIKDLFASCPDSDIAILDEPDQGLSAKSIVALVKTLKKWENEGTQVLVVCHNPVLIAAFEQVYSMEHRKWMLSTDFLSDAGISVHFKEGA